jgi:hypothetical protein
VAERCADVDAGKGIGLSLQEVKDLLQRLQKVIATEHAHDVVAANSSCGECGHELPRKGEASMVYRTPFGKLRLACPRLYSQCRCGARAYDSDLFNPLAMVVAQRTHPERGPKCQSVRDATFVLRAGGLDARHREQALHAQRPEEQSQRCSRLRQEALAVDG